MSKPKIEVNDKSYFKDIHFLYEIIYVMKTKDDLKLFLKDILTSSELKMLKRRWHIANLLAKGLDIRTVAEQSKTSTQTVSKIKKILEEGKGGLVSAINEAEKIVNQERKKYLKSKKVSQSSKFVSNWFD